jgi:SAM-dependent methyltransferase
MHVGTASQAHLRERATSMSTSSGEPVDIYAQIRSVWNDDAAAYDRRPGHGLQSERERWTWRRLLDKVFDPIYTGSPLRVLDVGTGTGEMATLLANMGHNVTAVDIAPAMLELARQKAEKMCVPLTLIESNAAQLPLDDDSVDVVFSRHLFWTLPKPIDTLREWVRVVRPGGMVAIADGWWDEPTRDMQVRRAIGKLIRGVAPGGSSDHAGYDGLLQHLPVAGGVSPYSIRYFLDQAGLERLKVRDLKSLRAAERRTIPPWLWIDRARFTWLATGMKPD